MTSTLPLPMPVTLEAAFEQFATFGNSAAQRSSAGNKEMDNTRFVKLCRVSLGLAISQIVWLDMRAMLRLP